MTQVLVDDKYAWLLNDFHWYFRQGYATTKYKNIAYRLHVIVAVAEWGDVPEGYVVHHKNEIKTDNRVDNLQVMRREDHSRLHNSGIKRPYMIERNKSQGHIDKISGDNCYMAKTTDNQWLDAIDKYFKGELKTYRDMAEYLGIAKSQPGMVLSGKSRTYLQPQILELKKLYGRE